MPLPCTRRPGAGPTMRTRAVGDARSTGLGGLGRWASQILHARTSASRRSNWAGSTRMIKSVLFAIRAPLMPPHLPLSPLNALSPLDGRYHKQLEPLRVCFSEAALFRYRIAVEIRWLLALAAEPAIAEIKPFSNATHAELERILENLADDARQGACERGAPAAARAALDRRGVPHREDERRGGQLQRPRRRVPELRLGALREGVRRVARPRIQSVHHPDRASRQPRRAV